MNLFKLIKDHVKRFREDPYGDSGDAEKLNDAFDKHILGHSTKGGKGSLKGDLKGIGSKLLDLFKDEV